MFEVNFTRFFYKSPVSSYTVFKNYISRLSYLNCKIDLELEFCCQIFCRHSILLVTRTKLVKVTTARTSTILLESNVKVSLALTLTLFTIIVIYNMLTYRG